MYIEPRVADLNLRHGQDSCCRLFFCGVLVFDTLVVTLDGRLLAPCLTVRYTSDNIFVRQIQHWLLVRFLLARV